jgi:hypothetical protein
MYRPSQPIYVLMLSLCKLLRHNRQLIVMVLTIDIDSLSLTPTKNGRLRKFELLHFGYVEQ